MFALILWLRVALLAGNCCGRFLVVVQLINGQQICDKAITDRNGYARPIQEPGVYSLFNLQTNKGSWWQLNINW